MNTPRHRRWAARAVASTGIAVMLAGAAAVVSTVSTAALRSTPAGPPAVARAGVLTGADTPAGFWYGTDSAAMNIPGPAPYHEPVLGGYYGGYVGMTGNWANLTGCHKIVVWSGTNSTQANNNYTWHHKGIGTGVYYFMGGPGVDPHYNGTAGEA